MAMLKEPSIAIQWVAVFSSVFIFQALVNLLSPGECLLANVVDISISIFWF